MKIGMSACLLGVPCRYDGQAKLHKRALELLKHVTIIPVCPEVAGGLACPRQACELVQGRALTKEKKDNTVSYQNGVKACLDILVLEKVDLAILKERSPSCGVHHIYDGSHTGTLISGYGLFCKALLEAGIPVISEEDLDRIIGTRYTFREVQDEQSRACEIIGCLREVIKTNNRNVNEKST